MNLVIVFFYYNFLKNCRKIFFSINLLLFFWLLNCKSLQKNFQALESHSSLEAKRNIKQNLEYNLLRKEKIFIFVNNNLYKKAESKILLYLQQRQNLFLEKLLKQNPELVILKSKENSDFVIENEYHENETWHHLVMLVSDTKKKLVKKYFFSIQVEEPKTGILGFIQNKRELLVAKSNLQKGISTYEEPLELEVLNFVRSAFYGKVYFYSNLPNVKVKCNQRLLGELPLTIELNSGKYECDFITREGISKSQRFYLSSGEELKVYQPFFETLSNTILIETLPEIPKVKVNEKTYTKLPVAISTNVQTISFHNFEKSLEFQIPNPTIREENSSTWVVLPFMLWDAFHPKFSNFWEKPSLLGTGIEMNRYLSVVNETKAFLNEWSFLESKPFFPESIIIEGGLFPFEDTGTGIFQFHFGTLRDYYTLEVEEERVSLFHFPSSKLSLGNYIYPILEEKKPREFSIQTNINSKTISIYLSGEKVLTRKFSFDSTWKISLSFKGGIFNRLNLLNHLKIAYPNLLTETEFQIWKQSGYSN